MDFGKVSQYMIMHFVVYLEILRKKTYYNEILNAVVFTREMYICVQNQNVAVIW